MGVLHAALAWAAVASVAVVLVLAVLTAIGRLRSYRALDVSLLVQVVATSLTSLAGLGAVGAVGPPRDPLHLLYGVVATALPFAVRVAAQGRPVPTIGRWVTVATLVTLGVTIRSFMTGS
jgi:hypothetical protein